MISWSRAIGVEEDMDDTMELYDITEFLGRDVSEGFSGFLIVGKAQTPRVYYVCRFWPSLGSVWVGWNWQRSRCRRGRIGGSGRL
jgi:hypothetical protein